MKTGQSYRVRVPDSSFPFPGSTCDHLTRCVWTIARSIVPMCMCLGPMDSEIHLQARPAGPLLI